VRKGVTGSSARNVIRGIMKSLWWPQAESGSYVINACDSVAED
jgi:hypothetical protein